MYAVDIHRGYHTQTEVNYISFSAIDIRTQPLP